MLSDCRSSSPKASPNTSRARWRSRAIRVGLAQLRGTPRRESADHSRCSTWRGSRGTSRRRSSRSPAEGECDDDEAAGIAQCAVPLRQRPPLQGMPRRARPGRALDRGEIRPARTDRPGARRDRPLRPAGCRARGARGRGGRSAASGCGARAGAGRARAQTVCRRRSTRATAQSRFCPITRRSTRLARGRSSAKAATPKREQSARRALALAPDDAARVDAAGPRAARARRRRRYIALRRRRSATGDIAAAEAAWRSALAIDPTNAEAMFYLGNAARERGESAEAIRIYEEALAHHPRRCAASEQPRARAGAVRRHRRRESAIRGGARRARRTRRGPRESRAAAASAFRTFRRLPRTITRMRPRSPMRPPISGRRLALCQHRIGALHAAEESYRKALERAPRDVDIQYGLAALLVELGRSGEAIPLLADLREEGPVGTRAPRAPVRAAPRLRLDRLGRDASTSCARTSARLPDHPGDTLIPLNALALPLSPAELLTIAQPVRRYVSRSAPLPRAAAPPRRGRRATPEDRLRVDRFPHASDRAPADRAVGAPRPRALRRPCVLDRRR